MAFKICMIEDDSDLAGLVKEYLERYDFEVSICEDFKNIDKFVDGHGPDLILLDINIPYFDGFYWCNEIRKKQGYLLYLLLQGRKTMTR